MNRLYAISVVITASAFSLGGQSLPGAPEENGLTPKTDTFYINSVATDPEIRNNGNTESLGVAITSTGNVVVGWEDDGDELNDFASVWTLFDSAGQWLTPITGQNSLANPSWGTVSNRFLSYFRADGSPVFAGTSWGPKIKANLFGEGFGMGATSYGLSAELAEFAAWDDANKGDVPTVQLLNENGTPRKFLPGLTIDYASRDGDVRIADWEFLDNGNILIVSESRQRPDLINVYGGETEGIHPIFRILDPSGAVVKAETLANEVPAAGEMWHGAAVFRGGFAVRFSTPPVFVRFFDNAGNPTTTNIDIVTATGSTVAGQGGRGGNVGFHGNGKDAVAMVATGSDPEDGLNKVWLTVLNTNGAVRFSKSVADDLELATVGGSDVAIDPDGNVIVVFDATPGTASMRSVMGRRFNAAGEPLGGTFYISEKELPDQIFLNSSTPRIAWRNNQVAVVWESANEGYTYDPEGNPAAVVALRYFSTFAPGTLESVGLTRIVPDRLVDVPPQDNKNNWEPYASVLGTNFFLVEANTFTRDSVDNQRYVVAVQPASGGAMKLVEGFYGDNGQPYDGQINASRQDGNPGRVAGDARRGATTFTVGGEASPHVFTDVFGGDNRWNLGFDRLSDGRYGVVQTYKLDPATLTPTPLSKAIDSANGRLTSGAAAGNQVTRFGGDIVYLDNGNFVSVVEDRSRVRADADCVVATIFAPDGTVVKESWVVVNSDIWANVAAFKGGFAIRAKPEDGSATRVIYFYDNAGNLKGIIDQATSEVSFDPGRGDGTRIFGHINSPYVFLAGKVTTAPLVKVAAFDSRTQKFAGIGDVNEGAFTGDFDRVTGASDALDRLVVSWVSQPAGYTQRQVAARVLSFNGTNFTALTRSFFPFVNAATNETRSLQMSVAMTTRQICVAAKGDINLQNQPEMGTNSPSQVNFFTVFSHPVPANDPTISATGESPELRFTSVTLVPGATPRLRVEWVGGGTLQGADNVTGGQWQDITGATSPYETPADSARRFFRVRQ